MQFPSAHKGVKKLFIAELIAIAAGLLALVAAVLAVVGIKNEGVLVAAGSITIVSTFALIVMLVLQLVGLFQGGKDSLQIKYAFFIALGGLVLSIVLAVLRLLPANSGLAIAIGVIGPLVDIATVLALAYTLLGIAELAAKLNDEPMARRGKFLAFVVVILFAISVVLNLFSNFFVNNAPSWAVTMIAIFGIVAAVVELVAYILTVIYYGRATKMLKK